MNVHFNIYVVKPRYRDSLFSRCKISVCCYTKTALKIYNKNVLPVRSILKCNLYHENIYLGKFSKASPYIFTCLCSATV